MNNKLLFQYNDSFSNDINIIANNEKDLKDYLENKSEYKKVNTDDWETISFCKKDSDLKNYVRLIWVKQI